MSIYTVDDQGQIIVTPSVLDEFEYYRDHTLVRRFRESVNFDYVEYEYVNTYPIIFPLDPTHLSDYIISNLTIRIDSSDVIHIAFCVRVDSEYKLIYQTVYGDIFTTEVIIDGIPQGANSLEMKLDSNKYPHILYNWSDLGTPTNDYWYKDGSGWHKENIANIFYNPDDKTYSICLDSNNAVHVYLQDSISHELRHYYKSGTWTYEVIYDDGNDKRFFASTAIGTDLYLLTSDDGNYQGALYVDTGSGWNRTYLSTFQNYDDGTMVDLYADSDDNLYMLGMIGYDGYHGYVNVWDNKLGSWRKTEVIHYYEGSDEYVFDHFSFHVTSDGLLGCIYSFENGAYLLKYFSGTAPTFSTPIDVADSDYHAVGFVFDSNNHPHGCYEDRTQGLIMLNPEDF